MKNVGLYETKGMLVKAGRPKLCVKAFISFKDVRIRQIVILYSNGTHRLETETSICYAF